MIGCGSVCQKLMRPGCPLDLCCLSQRVAVPAFYVTSATDSLGHPQVYQAVLYANFSAIVPDYLVAVLAKTSGRHHNAWTLVAVRAVDIRP